MTGSNMMELFFQQKQLELIVLQHVRLLWKIARAYNHIQKWTLKATAPFFQRSNTIFLTLCVSLAKFKTKDKDGSIFTWFTQNLQNTVKYILRWPSFLSLQIAFFFLLLFSCLVTLITGIVYLLLDASLGAIQLLRSHSGWEGGIPQNANKSERGGGGGGILA